MPGSCVNTPPVASLLASTSLVLLLCCSSQDGAADGLVATALPEYLDAFGLGLPAPSRTTRMVAEAMALGDMVHARELSRNAVTVAPEDAEAAFSRGVVLVTDSSFSVARTFLERAVENGPSCAGSEYVFYYYGICLMRLGEGELARESFLAHLEIRPNDGDTLSALGELALQEGDPELALTFYRSAIAMLEADEDSGVPTGPSRACARLGVADALLQQGHLEDALDAAQASIALDPSEAEAWYKLSRIQIQLGHEEAATVSFRQFALLGAGR